MPTIENPYVSSASPYPTPNWGQAGVNLGTALFGNPQMALQQNLIRAQANNFNADAAQRQGDAARFQAEAAAAQDKTSALQSLDGPTGFGGIYSTAPATVTTPAAAPGHAATTAPNPSAGQITIDQPTLAHVVATLARAGVADPAKIIAAYTGYSGNDGIGRGALISQGINPSDKFAINQGDAQNMAATAAAADQAREVAGKAEAGKWELAGAQAHSAAEIAAARIAAAAAEDGHNLVYRAATQDTASRDAEKRWELTHGGNPRSIPQPGALDGEISAQIGWNPKNIIGGAAGSDPLSPEQRTAIRSAAAQIMLTGNKNETDAVTQALANSGLQRQEHVGALISGMGGQTAYVAAPRPVASGGGRVIKFDAHGNRVGG